MNKSNSRCPRWVGRLVRRLSGWAWQSERNDARKYLDLCSVHLALERRYGVYREALERIACNDPEYNRQNADAIAITALSMPNVKDQRRPAND